MGEPAKCLSLKQPFAELVVTGRKTIELRHWNTHFRGEFLVHASGNPDREAFEKFGIALESLPRRAIVGKATLYDVKEYKGEADFAADKDKHLASGGYYAESRYGFLLNDAKKFDKPIPISGKLGFFEVDVKAP